MFNNSYFSGSPFLKMTTVSHEQHLHSNNVVTNESQQTPTTNSFTYSFASAPSIERDATNTNCSNCKRSQQILVCYTPANSQGFTSCTREKTDEKLIYTTDTRAAIIPANSIVDSIEFFGIDSFSTKDTFSIGFGLMNGDISFPLVIDVCPEVANERVGGFREFLSQREDGRNEKCILLCDSFINVSCNQPITRGGLQIIIRYHMKIV
jgi:hypothetical protein